MWIRSKRNATSRNRSMCSIAQRHDVSIVACLALFLGKDQHSEQKQNEAGRCLSIRSPWHGRAHIINDLFLGFDRVAGIEVKDGLVGLDAGDGTAGAQTNWQ